MSDKKIDPIQELANMVFSVFEDDLGDLRDGVSERSEAEMFVSSEIGDTSINPSTKKPFMSPATYDAVVEKVQEMIRNKRRLVSEEAMTEQGFGSW